MILEILVFMLVGANASKTLQSRVALVVGLNPALQRTVTLSTSLQVGSVNRGSSVQVIFISKETDHIAADSIVLFPSLKYHRKGWNWWKGSGCDCCWC